MKVLIPIRHPIGGIRTYLRYTYGRFNPEKYDLVIVYPQDYENEEDANRISTDLRRLRLSVVLTKSKDPLLSLFLTILRLLINEHFDIIHSQGSTCGIIVSVINVIFRKPHIITFHETFDELSTFGKLSLFKSRVIGFLFSRADALNTVSNDAKFNLLKVFPNIVKQSHNITVIPNGVDTIYFRDDIENEKSIYNIEGIDNGAFVIGFLGRYMPEKGFLILVDSIQILFQQYGTRKTVKVLSLGWGAFIREYQAYIREKGLTDCFVFIEFQPDIRWILRQIHVLAVPSMREAFGLVAIEGLVCGTPIVASDCIGLREVLEGTPARMIKAGDSHDLAEKISEIKENYLIVKREFVEFVPKAIKMFDSKESAAKLDRLIRQIVRKKNTRV